MSSAQTEREQAAKLPENDIIGVLLTQHARIRGLFSDVKNAAGDQKKEKFNELRALLAVHETAEEMILRPVTKKITGKEQAEARNREEKEANKVLSDLEKLDISSPEFARMLEDLEHSVAEHADHEEREEFPSVLRECEAEEREKMGKRLLAAEKVAPTRPHPMAAGSPAAQWTVGPFASLLDRAKEAVTPSSGSS